MAEKPVRPPYRLVTERLVLRCFEPGDARELKELVEANVEHLRPWMPWAEREPQTLDEKVDLVLRFRGRFDLGIDFSYGVFERGSGALVGGAGLHRECGPGGIEVGYWIDRGHTRRGWATEAAGALTRVAFATCDVARVEIRCAPDNEASNALARALGFTRDGVARASLPWPDGSHRDSVLWSILAGEHAARPALPLEAFDALGRRVL